MIKVPAEGMIVRTRSKKDCCSGYDCGLIGAIIKIDHVDSFLVKTDAGEFWHCRDCVTEVKDGQA